MKIIVAAHFGICFGVRDAIAQAETLAREAPLTILGELVHNPIVREHLRAQGIREEPSDRAPQTSRVMITAHCTSDRRREALTRRGLVVADGTCPLVRYAHEQLKRLVQTGYFPVVIGLGNHVEVRGLVGDFADAFVINESADTVCKPTKDRQLALKKLIEMADVIVVVGGRQSNNTRQLVETCRAAGKRALHIERPEELEAEWFRGVNVVGLTGGTSTLPETVEAVRQRLEEFHD